MDLTRRGPALLDSSRAQEHEAPRPEAGVPCEVHKRRRRRAWVQYPGHHEENGADGPGSSSSGQRGLPRRAVGPVEADACDAAVQSTLAACRSGAMRLPTVPVPPVRKTAPSSDGLVVAATAEAAMVIRLQTLACNCEVART